MNRHRQRVRQSALFKDSTQAERRQIATVHADPDVPPLGELAGITARFEDVELRVDIKLVGTAHDCTTRLDSSPLRISLMAQSDHSTSPLS